jgi:hypothetical protein
MGILQQSIVNSVTSCGEFLHYGDKKNGCANTTKEFEWSNQVYVAGNGCSKRP